MFNPIISSVKSLPPYSQSNSNPKVLVDQLLDPNSVDAWVSRTGRPYVTLSWAQSLDGSLTLKQGESSPISCPDSMRMTHQLRSQHDAILVGIGTVLADDPSLTARTDSSRACKQPRPIILDSRLRISAESRVFNHPIQPIVATTRLPNQTQQRNLNADIIHLSPTADGDVALKPLLHQLGKIGIKSIMVEGGGQIITSFLNAHLANRAIITISPVFVGGYDAVQPLNQTDWQQLPRLTNMKTRPCGCDLIVSGNFDQTQASD